MSTEEILERLMREYGDSVFRMCFLYLKDYHLAEDATQETFIKAMRSYDSFLHNSKEKTWLIRIAINTCKNVMRTRWFRFPVIDIEEQQHLDAHNSIDELIEKDSVSNAINQQLRRARKKLKDYLKEEPHE